MLVVCGTLALPSAAGAATAAFTSITPNPGGGLTVATTVTTDQSDCSQGGYCGWFLELSAVPANQSCNVWNDAELAAVGPLEDSTGATSLTLSASLAQAGSIDVCAFADLANNLGTPTFLASTTYTTPAATGTVSVAPISATQLGGTVSVDEPYCDSYCVWSANTYVQDGSAPCSTAPSGTSVSTGPDEYNLGTQSWAYSFTPDISTGSLEVCTYVGDGSLVASNSYAFPAAQTVTVKKTTAPKPRLLVSTGRSELRRALLRRYRGAQKLKLACRSQSATEVKCNVSLKRTGSVYGGAATARLSGKFLHISWSLKRRSSTTPTVTTPTTTTPTTTTPTTTNPTPTKTTPTTVSCTPLSNEGTCYEPGEYCRTTDHGATGIAGDGEAIICEDNDGWRWEPTS